MEKIYVIRTLFVCTKDLGLIEIENDMFGYAYKTKEDAFKSLNDAIYERISDEIDKYNIVFKDHTISVNKLDDFTIDKYEIVELEIK